MSIFNFWKKNADKNLPSSARTNNSANIESSPLNLSEESAPDLELSDLLKSATPSKRGLYPHEILMLHFAPKYKINNDNFFPDFWYGQYSVTDPQSVLNSLFNRGFIEAGDLRSTLEKLKIPEIKSELKALNEKTTGRKAELIDRLLEVADHDILGKKYPDRYYRLTPDGQQELDDNPYVFYLNRHGYMTIWEMNYALNHEFKGYTYRDVLWDLFNRQSGEHFRNYDFGLYRNIRMSMYQFLMEENKPKRAFKFLCEVVIYDLSYTSNGMSYFFECEATDPQSYLFFYESDTRHIAPYEESVFILPPYIIGCLADMQTKLGLSDEDFREALLQNFENYTHPLRVFTNEECADIVLAEINQAQESLEAIYSIADKRNALKLALLKIELDND